MAKQTRQPAYRNYSSSKPSYKSPKSKKGRSAMKVIALVIVLAAIFAVPTYAFVHTNDATKQTSHSDTKTTVATIAQKPATTTPAVQTQTTACSGNTLPELLVASISQRHLWACDGTQVLYQTPVVTGDMNVVADVTPVGTYKIYAKETDQHLIGSDSRGSWDDFVNYWMPFLDNQYGVFGLHDATWRAPSDFGNISPYSDNASHGCIELPLAAAQWIYNWSSVGTTVTIES